jgi:hypothetical protein
VPVSMDGRGRHEHSVLWCFRDWRRQQTGRHRTASFGSSGSGGGDIGSMMLVMVLARGQAAVVGKSERLTYMSAERNCTCSLHVCKPASAETLALFGTSITVVVLLKYGCDQIASRAVTRSRLHV